MTSWNIARNREELIIQINAIEKMVKMRGDSKGLSEFVILNRYFAGMRMGYSKIRCRNGKADRTRVREAESPLICDYISTTSSCTYTLQLGLQRCKGVEQYDF